MRVSLSKGAHVAPSRTLLRGRARLLALASRQVIALVSKLSDSKCGNAC